MSKKRRQHSPELKARVGLAALKGIEPVHAIAAKYQVHPVQVTQWKGVIRDRLPELFEAGHRPEGDQEALIAQLHEKIGQLTVEADWLKKKCRQLGL